MLHIVYSVSQFPLVIRVFVVVVGWLGFVRSTLSVEKTVLSHEKHYEYVIVSVLGNAFVLGLSDTVVRRHK